MATTSNQANYIYRQGTSPNTRAASSQKNKIYGYQNGKKGFYQLGVISEFGYDESRGVDPVRGVGYGDQIAELVPGATEPMTLTLNKTLLYATNLFQIVGYKGGIEGIVRSLRHHRWPFDIKQELVFSELASENMENLPNALINPTPQTGHEPIRTPKALLTFFEGCWFNNYSVSFTSDAAIVSETSSVTVTDIIDGVSQYGEYISTGLEPIESNGTAGAGYSLRFATGSNLVGQVPTP